MLGDLFYRVGAAIGALDAQVRGVTGAEAPVGTREVAIYDSDETMENVAMVGAAGWLLSRLLQPRAVSWPRVIVAGIAATALADLVGRTVDHEPGRRPEHPQDPEELLARYGAGIAIAAGYASLLYSRIPGSPLFRGLAFGAMEVFAAPRGGLVSFAARAPGIQFPLQTLAFPVERDAGPLAHLAYGVGLGLFYRYDPDE